MGYDAVPKARTRSQIRCPIDKQIRYMMDFFVKVDTCMMTGPRETFQVQRNVVHVHHQHDHEQSIQIISFYFIFQFQQNQKNLSFLAMISLLSMLMNNLRDLTTFQITTKIELNFSQSFANYTRLCFNTITLFINT